MQVFSLLADWHRCSSTHHRCPSANNHVANDPSVWQTVPSWFLWYLWASLSLVLAESRWDFNFVACSCGLAVSLWLVCSWWAHSFVRFLMVWDYLNTENCVKPTSCSVLWEHGQVLCSEFRSLLEPSMWCCYCMKFHWTKVLPWWQWKAEIDLNGERRENVNFWGRFWGIWCSQISVGRGKKQHIWVYFNVQVSIVMKVDETGFLRALALLNLL